jgi:hypothetical protein
MDAYSTIEASEPAGTIRPARLSSLLFAAKATIFRMRRALADFGAPVRRLARGDATAFPVCQAVSRTALWPDVGAGETELQRGKVQNLRIAARRLDGARLDPGKTFSFWAELGRPSRRRGFASGRTLQEGCLIPSIGGGLCQLSNALYDAALQAGCEIVERHPHSRVIPGSAAAVGRDATVAWNYVDLRFRSARPLLLRVTLEQDHLVVSLFAEAESVTAPRRTVAEAISAVARSCGSCGQTDCHRHERPRPASAGRTARCVDELWPEFDAYLARERKSGDVLCLPLDGGRWHRPNYAWTTAGFSQVHTALAATVFALSPAAASPTRARRARRRSCDRQKPWRAPMRRRCRRT